MIMCGGKPLIRQCVVSTLPRQRDSQGTLCARRNHRQRVRGRPPHPRRV